MFLRETSPPSTATVGYCGPLPLCINRYASSSLLCTPSAYRPPPRNVPITSCWPRKSRNRASSIHDVHEGHEAFSCVNGTEKFLASIFPAAVPFHPLLLIWIWVTLVQDELVDEQNVPVLPHLENELDDQVHGQRDDAQKDGAADAAVELCQRVVSEPLRDEQVQELEGPLVALVVLVDAHIRDVPDGSTTCSNASKLLPTTFAAARSVWAISSRASRPRLEAHMLSKSKKSNNDRVKDNLVHEGIDR